MVERTKRDDADGARARLLACVRDLMAELQPGRPAETVTLDQVLDRELGIDSLGRVELFGRLEREFGVGLPDSLFAAAETPRDLLRAIEGAAPPTTADEPPVPATAPPGTADGGAAVVPAHQARTLIDALDHHADRHPDRVHIRFHADGGDAAAEEALTYGTLRDRARRIATGLRLAGLAGGEAVTIMLPTGPDYMAAFFGVVLAGGAPAPLYPPGRPAQLEDHLRRHAVIVENCRARFLITVPEAQAFTQLLKMQVPSLETVATVADLDEPAADLPTDIAPGDTALLQYTSGSTGNPKGVVLSHANLLANIRAMGAALDAGPDDVFVSWLPLYHDMGLIGAWLGSLYFGTTLVLMSPLAFLARPERWLAAIDRHRATISGAPNFAYDLCTRRIPDERLTEFDLSSWRCAFNGAESVNAGTMAAFCERFAAAGFDRRAMMPVYGLAESSVGLCFPPIGRGPVVDSVNRDALLGRGRAEPADADDATAVKVVSCGLPLPGHEVRIIDETGHELPERHVGRLQFAGPSATAGYFRNAGETARLVDGPWRNSGDLAYTAGGEIYITGRSKELIIRGGRNIYPVEIENAIGALEGIQRGDVAVFGSADPESGTERLIVLAATRRRGSDDQTALRRRIIALVTDLTGVPPDDVVLAPPRTVPKTSSGKVKRTLCRNIYEQGRIGEPGRAVWWQVARLTLAGAGPILRRLARTAGGYLYAAYTWGLAGLAATALWPAIVALPVRAWRWRLIHPVGHLLAAAAGLPISLRGRENLPPRGQPCLFVCNHASYLDSLVLSAALPRDLRFVAKAELRRNPLLRPILGRLGAEFVERFDARKGTADAERLAEQAPVGGPLVFFAEGTLTRAAGLRPFQMGAFTTATAAGLPVVPITLRGTRAALRDGAWFPRRGPIGIVVSPAISPDMTAAGENAWAEAVRLRDAVRGEILRHCGEPDLVGERPDLFSQKPARRGGEDAS